MKNKKRWINFWVDFLKAGVKNCKIDEKKLKGILKKELVVALYDVLEQATITPEGDNDTNALMSFAIGVAVLAKAGLVKIKACYGRRAIFKMKNIYKRREK